MSEDRAKVRSEVKAAVTLFYGEACVVTGGWYTLHHLNGDGTQSEFEHLIPLQWELHSQLRRERDRVRTRDCPGELRPEELLDTARYIYRLGNTSRAFGCARLAHSTRRYFLEELFEDELLCAGEALYYLRRSSGSRGARTLSLLRYMMAQEVIPALKSSPRLASRTTLLVAEEFASWLNEQGWAKDALPYLQRISDVTRIQQFCPLTPGERSRLLRQLAFSQIILGVHSEQVKCTLEEANHATDHPQNRHGVLNARVMLALRDRLPVLAWETLEEQLSELGVAEPWAIDFIHPERSGVTYPTLIAPLAHMMIAALYDSPQGTANHEELREQLTKVETRMGQKAALAWGENTLQQTVRAGGDEGLLRSHTMTRCSREDAALLQEALAYISV